MAPLSINLFLAFVSLAYNPYQIRCLTGFHVITSSEHSSKYENIQAICFPVVDDILVESWRLVISGC